MSEMGKYIYGIVNSDKEIFFPSCKVITDREVYTITYHDISAVISESEIIDYNRLPKDNVARYLISHQMVIEKVMEDFTIIPMRLGTYAVDGNEVRHILLKGYKVIKGIFEKTNGMVEVDVVVTWGNLEEVIKGVSEEGEIKEFKQSLLDKKEGVTINDQMRIGSLIKNYLDKRREQYANMIETSLTQMSHNHRIHGLMDDRMVFNTAFLIDNSMLKDFEKRVEKLNSEFTEKLKFKCIGPLPPYSFNTLETKKIRSVDIASAREKLKLSDIATREEIKKAYKQQALLYHPDKNSGGSDTHEQFDQITKAYKMLLEYCDGEACSFKEGDPAGDVIIVVRPFDRLRAHYM